MALAMKKACCGRSLRASSLLLVYINVVIKGWNLFLMFRSPPTLSYFQMFDCDRSMSMISDRVWTAFGLLLFLIIMFTYRGKHIYLLFTVAVFHLLVSAAYNFYAMIILDTRGAMNYFFFYVETHEKVDIGSTCHFRLPYNSSFTMLPVHAIFVISIAFKFYSALVFHSYKVELIQQPFYGVPSRRSVAYKVASERLLCPLNAENVTSQYHTEPVQCVVLPPQKSTQPAQSPAVLLQCHTQLTQNADVPLEQPTSAKFPVKHSQHHVLLPPQNVVPLQNPTSAQYPIKFSQQHIPPPQNDVAPECPTFAQYSVKLSQNHTEPTQDIIPPPYPASARLPVKFSQNHTEPAENSVDDLQCSDQLSQSSSSSFDDSPRTPPPRYEDVCD